MASPGLVEQAVSNFVDNGLYPEDENVITAELPSATLQSLGKLLDRARTDVKTSIRELSRLSAPDIDGWITQAKQLKDDIDDSVAQSEEIVQLGQDNAQLQEQTRDAAGKVNLLQGEVAFNRTLVSTLETIQQVRLVVNQTAAAVSNDSISDAVSGLSRARAGLDTLGTFGTTSVARLLGENIDELQQRLHTSLDAHWARFIVVKSSSSTITVHEQAKGPSFEEVSSALAKYDLLAPKIIDFWRALDSLILGPWLARRDGKALGIDVRGHVLSLARPPGPISIGNLFRDVKALRNFLQAQLPATVGAQLSGLVMPSLLSRLVSGPLQAAVPADLGGIPSFVETLTQVSRFQQDLQQTGWNDISGLSAWVANAPNVWLQGRNADSLNSMRQLLKRGLGNPRIVERVETQTITENDDMLGPAGGDDDWDAGWEEPETPANAPVATQSAGAPVADEEEDNAWGWDEEGEQPATGPGTAPAADNVDEDGGEAWGWGDEDKADSPVVEQGHALNLAQRQEAHDSRPTNGGHTAVPTERTVTLRESYHITALPESILELIIMVVEDADSLSRTSDNPVAPAAKGLYTLTGLLLGMYRASAPVAYALHESGNMFFYNDSQYLAEQLRLFANHHASRDTSGPLNLHNDIVALEAFGKRAYSNEMESQRIILGDMLDGAESFVNCTDGLRAGQCDLAVTSVIDRIQQVNLQWKSVLSASALLQSTGSLLSTVIGKIILDIEDMNDIQESESKALTAYCSSIESLESLFLPEQDASEGAEPPVPLTAGYVPSWLKFQYLSNILDSSLVDIKYLWTEGSLSLEFDAEEVVDLIEALFADSSRRKEAISEIRRSAR